GALGKVRALDEDHPDLAPPAPAPARSRLALDAVGIARASQALSSEISLRALLERVLRVIVQTSGAQRGAILTETDGALRVEARLDLERGVLESARPAAGVVSE